MISKIIFLSICFASDTGSVPTEKTEVVSEKTETESSMITVVTGTSSLVEDKTIAMKRDVIALELFLRDQKNYKNFCSGIKWVQPSIEVYKVKLSSQLPETCKAKIPAGNN